MQNLEHSRFEKHDEQISDIKDVMSELSSQIKVMSANYFHISEQVKEVLSEVKKMRNEQHKLSQVESLITGVIAKNLELEKRVHAHQEFYIHINSKMTRKEELKKILLSSGFVTLAIATITGLAWVIDFIYRVKIH